MARWQVLLAAGLLIAVGFVSAFYAPLWRAATPPDAEHAGLRLRNRERLEVAVHDGRYRPPDAATRQSFDGRWTGQTDAGKVVIVFLDGVGDLLLVAGASRHLWAIEVTQYFGDDLFDLGVWQGDKVTVWTGSRDEAEDTIRVWIMEPGYGGLPSEAFVLRRM